MNYYEAKSELLKSLYMGNEIELENKDAPCKKLDEDQIEFVASWLAGEGFVK